MAEPYSFFYLLSDSAIQRFSDNLTIYADIILRKVHGLVSMSYVCLSHISN